MFSLPTQVLRRLDANDTDAEGWSGVVERLASLDGARLWQDRVGRLWRVACGLWACQELKRARSSNLVEWQGKGELCAGVARVRDLRTMVRKSST